jgi:four helix bundle protein
LGVELRKAATSLSSYVTEGSSRNEQEEQTDLLLLAYESLVEISNKLIIAKRLSVVHPKSFEILQLRIKDLAVKINKVAKPDEA